MKYALFKYFFLLILVVSRQKGKAATSEQWCFQHRTVFRTEEFALLFNMTSCMVLPSYYSQGKAYPIYNANWISYRRDSEKLLQWCNSCNCMFQYFPFSISFASDKHVSWFIFICFIYSIRYYIDIGYILLSLFFLSEFPYDFTVRSLGKQSANLTVLETYVSWNTRCTQSVSTVIALRMKTGVWKVLEKKENA